MTATGTTRSAIVIGGGMLGAAIAEGLADAGRPVVLVEAAPSLGGLASAWTVATAAGPVTWDRFYHVVLGQDRRVVALLQRLGLADTLHFTTAGSEMLAGGRVHPMSSVLDLLKLPVLDPLSRVRVGATVALGALLPVAGGDRTTSARWLRRISGPRAAEALWLPLLRAKLGESAEQASGRFIRSTFRRLLVARLKGGDGDRFGWVEGGYASVLGAYADRLAGLGVDIRTATTATAVRRDGDHWIVTVAGRGGGTDQKLQADEEPRSDQAVPADEHLLADDVVIATPGPVARSLAGGAAACGATVDPGLLDRLDQVPYLGCVCVSVVLRRQVTGGYLTYVTDDTPYTAVVEMTNLVDGPTPGIPAGAHLVYLPRYCAPDDAAFDALPQEIIDRYVDDLISRYPAISRDDVLATALARARHVMPVPVPGRGELAPPVTTGAPGLYLASSAQVTDGTLNVETTLHLAERALAVLLTATPATPAADLPGAPSEPTAPNGPRPTAFVRQPVAAVPQRQSRTRAGKANRPTASVSLDADNLWSYLKTHGNPDWEKRPGYLPALGPRLLEAYGRHGITGTVFVVGHDAATDDGAAFVSSLTRAGHEIANHSFEHEPWLHLYSRDQLDDELGRTEQAIMAAGAPRPTGFRGPGYSLSPTLLELLEERGYRYDATTLPTWIGPLARAYYFRSAKLSAAERDKRQALFGSASEGRRPVGPYRWRTGNRPPGQGLVELPVTTMPVAKVPIHVSYVLHLHQVRPELAKAYVSTSMRACRLAGVGPSILLHPLDLLDASDAPGLEFFPGMALPASEKAAVLDHVLSRMTRDFDVVGTGEHARRVALRALPEHDAATAGSPTS
jgi:protoporphyrinogen oxidase/peptidoglycan/xylan/chitin deacetylase (PgdA/CDA1 family)